MGAFMEWFDITALGTVAFGGWIFISIAVLPHFIRRTGIVLIVVLIGGILIFWGFYIVAPRPPFIIMTFNLLIVIAALLAGFHSELLERRRTGRWRFLEPGK